MRRNISCHISKQKSHSHQWLQCSSMSWLALWALRKEKNTCDLPAIRLQPLLAVSSKKAQDVKTQDTGSRQLKCIWRSDFIEFRLLHLPIQRKPLNSLTSAIWLSLINNDPLDVWTTCSLLQSFCKTWIPPCLLRTFLLGLLEMIPPGPEALKFPTEIKRNFKVETIS